MTKIAHKSRCMFTVQYNDIGEKNLMYAVMYEYNGKKGTEM